MTKTIHVALATVAALTMAAAARAQEPASTSTAEAAPAPPEADKPAITVTGTAAVVSDYRFRGVSLSDRDPAVQASITVTSRPGFFVGTWASSIEPIGGYVDRNGDIKNGAEVEVDIFGGWTGALGPVNTTVGIYGYVYPGGRDVSYYEVYGSVGGAVGPASVLVGINYAPDQENYDEDNIYVYGDVSFGIPNLPVTLKAHLGYEEGVFVPPFAGSDDKLDYLLGVDVKYKALTFGVAYVGNDVDEDDVPGFGAIRDQVVFSLTAGF